MTNGNDSTSSISVTRVGDNDYRPSKAGDDKTWMHTSTGLTKREYFAALAMQGMVMATFSPIGLRGGDVNALSDYAVKQADALIAELNKQ